MAWSFRSKKGRGSIARTAGNIQHNITPILIWKYLYALLDLGWDNSSSLFCFPFGVRQSVQPNCAPESKGCRITGSIVIELLLLLPPPLLLLLLIRELLLASCWSSVRRSAISKSRKTSVSLESTKLKRLKSTSK